MRISVDVSTGEQDTYLYDKIDLSDHNHVCGTATIVSHFKISNLVVKGELCLYYASGYYALHLKRGTRSRCKGLSHYQYFV